MSGMLPQWGLAAGATGWKAGHAAVLSGFLILDELDEQARNERLAAYAAEQARAYMGEMVTAHNLTPAEGVGVWRVYMRAFMRGALDQALDAGALLQGS